MNTTTTVLIIVGFCLLIYFCTNKRKCRCDGYAPQYVHLSAGGISGPVSPDFPSALPLVYVAHVPSISEGFEMPSKSDNDYINLGCRCPPECPCRRACNNPNFRGKCPCCSG